MRILQISSAKNFGGGEKHLVDLSKSLAEKNHDVFAALRPKTEWKEKLASLPPENVSYVPLRNALDIFSARQLAKIIREKHIEIIHAHLARDYTIASLAARFAPQAKVILTRHVVFPIKKFQKIALSNVPRAIAVSDAVKTQLECIFPAEKVILIPNGIDVTKFDETSSHKQGQEFRFEHNIPFDVLLIGTIGELKLLKGQEDFVLAMQIVAQQNSDARFIIVGKDNSFDQSFRRELKRLIKVFGLENNFLFLDWVEDTAPLLSALDIFVSASHSESFGLAILEAMASGKAIVATATDGAQELIEDGISGKLVEIKKPVAIAEAVSDLLANKELGRSFGANARRAAAENFSLERMVSETEKVYVDVLQNK